MNINDKNVLHKLIVQSRKGDPDAFAQIYNLLSKKVYYNAVRILGSENDAGDILQEVMLRLHRSMSEIRNPKALYAYVYRITYSCCMNLLGKNNAVPNSDEVDVALEYEAEDSPEFLPEEYAIVQERREYILSQIDQLRPDSRAVLLMFYYDQLSVREIAQAMGVNVHTAKSKLFRAKQQLQQKLEHKEMKGVLRVMAIPVPILTKIYQIDAESVFPDEVKEQIWNSIAGELGIGTATLAIAAGASATSTTAGAITVATSIKVIGSLAAITAITAAVVLETGLVDLKQLFRSPDNLEEPTYAIFSGPLPGASIEDAPPPLDAEEYASSAHPHFANEDSFSPSFSAEDPTSAEASRTDNQVQSAVAIQNTQLRYSVGAILSESRILADAGVTLEEDVDMVVLHLDAVDTSRPRDYGVLLRVGDSEEEWVYCAILIIIE